MFLFFSHSLTLPGIALRYVSMRMQTYIVVVPFCSGSFSPRASSCDSTRYPVKTIM